MTKWSENSRTIAAAVVLQLYAGIDPDYSRTLATKVVRAVDRAKARGHSHAGPTDEEVTRAAAELRRRGLEVSDEDARAALDAALTRGWGK